MKINREAFITVLESVSPGLAAKEQIEQSTCYAFQAGDVFTFNDEIFCRRPSGLPQDLTGATRADKMVEQLSKWLDDELEAGVKGNDLVFSAKKRKTGFKLETAITLPILDEAEAPTEWKKLPEGFSEAVAVAQQCASNDESGNFSLVCVHIAPKHVEACDNFQAARWPIKTGLKKPVLIRRASIAHVAKMGAEEWAETKGWLHFRSKSGLVLSVRRYLEEYPDLSSAFAGEGKPVRLPKGLADSCDKAAVFSSEVTDENNVVITLSPGKLIIRGEGVSGWYSESKKVGYSGPALTFCASPVVLADLVKRHTEAVIAPGKLIVDAGTYRYVLHLFVPDANPPQDDNPPQEGNGQDDEDTAQEGKKRMKKVKQDREAAEEPDDDA